MESEPILVSTKSIKDHFPFSFASLSFFEILSVATAPLAIFVRGSGESGYLSVPNSNSFPNLSVLHVTETIL